MYAFLDLPLALTIDNWVAESADAAAAEQAAQFGGIVRFQSNTSNPWWSCAVRLWWPLGACKPIAGSSTMCSVQNVQFCHFLGAWCWDLTMPLHILLLCNDLAYSITLKWIVTCAFYRIFIAWHCTAIYCMACSIYTSPHLDIHQSHPDPLIAPWCFIRLIRVIWIHLKLVRMGYCVQLHALRRFRSLHWEQLSRLVCGV